MNGRVSHSAEERSVRKERVAAAKTALRESSQLSGPQVSAARAALKDYLRRLNEPSQPSDLVFRDMCSAPFAQPRRKP